MDAGRFKLSRSERKRIADALSAAESLTSGEIVVRVVPHVKGAPRGHALREFHRLGMEKTRDRTGVLLFVAAKDRAIEVLGDAGIHAKVPEGFWDALVAKLSTAFKAGRHAEGLCEAVREIGALLSEHFPRKPDDANELPDRPVIC